MTTPEDWYTPEQAVHFFPDTAPSALRRQARAGLIPSRRFARRTYFSASDIAAIQEASRVHVRPLLDQGPRSKARTR